MKILITRSTVIETGPVEAGETVEVTESTASLLFYLGKAEPAPEYLPKAKKPKAEKPEPPEHEAT